MTTLEASSVENQKSRSAWKLASWLILAIGAIFASLIVWHVKAHNSGVLMAVKRNQCEHNLEAVYQAVADHVARNGDVPRDDKGQFSLQTLQLKSKAAFTIYCPGGDESNHPDYEFIKDISANDFRKNASQPRLIMWDKYGNHCDAWGNCNSHCLLYSDGMVFTTMKQGEQYEKWVHSPASANREDQE